MGPSTRFSAASAFHTRSPPIASITKMSAPPPMAAREKEGGIGMNCANTTNMRTTVARSSTRSTMIEESARAIDTCDFSPMTYARATSPSRNGSVQFSM